jgi:hypothetical protein
MPCFFISNHNLQVELLCFALGALLPQVQYDHFLCIVVECSGHD